MAAHSKRYIFLQTLVKMSTEMQFQSNGMGLNVDHRGVHTP